MSFPRYQFLLVLVYFAINGCESSMPVQSAQGDNFVSRVREQAIRLEEEGDLPRAMYQWQVVAGMQANDAQAKSELQRLRKLIGAKIARLESDFEKARNGNSSKRRKLLALKLLALDGKHTIARDYLQDYEHQSALVMQSQKDRDALQAQATRQEKADQELLVQEQVQQDEQKRLRAQAQQAAKIAEANSRKGDNLYRAGIKALSVDLEKAIALLTESLVYKPDNIQAEQHILRAKKMQATLRRIERSSSGN